MESIQIKIRQIVVKGIEMFEVFYMKQTDFEYEILLDRFYSFEGAHGFAVNYKKRIEQWKEWRFDRSVDKAQSREDVMVQLIKQKSMDLSKFKG